MGGGLEIIVLAMVAGFIALRLVSVLGRRSDDDPTRENPRRENPYGMGQPPERADGNVTQLPGTESIAGPRDQASDIYVDYNSPVGQVLSRIRSADRNFDPETFVGGARGAYAMIIEAFAAGDRDTLKPLLSDDVFDGFSQAIADREAMKHQAQTKVVDILKSDITDASLEKGVAEVTVTFVAEMISVVRDEEDRTVDGNPSDPETVTDIWTFSRPTKSRDPNWFLVATESEA